MNELIHMTYLFLLPFPPHVLANWACLERKNRNTLSKIFLILHLLNPPSYIFIYLLKKKAYTLLYFSNANFQQAFLTTTVVPLWGKKRENDVNKFFTYRWAILPFNLLF